MGNGGAVKSEPRLKPRPDTKISALLKAYPEMVEVLARFNRHFELLRRPTLRKLMTPLVTIEKAARTADVDVGSMLEAIYTALGAPVPADLQDAPGRLDHPAASPDWLRNLSGDQAVVLDVREEARSGQEPYHHIMKAVASLKAGQVLRLCNLFEPVPLYDVLAQRGFAHLTERRGPQEWWITFYRAPVETGAEKPAPGAAASSRETGEPLQVDARGLEPPQPMARILEALSAIQGGGELHALTDRRPLLLYQKLEERGYQYVTEEGNGWFKTRIWK